MFAFTLDPCALLLRQAVTPFIQAEAYNGEIYVTPTLVTLIAEASGGVVIVLRMKPSVFNTFTCTKNLSLGLDLRVLYRNLLRARTDAFLCLSGNETSGHIDFGLLNMRTLQGYRIHIPLLSRSNEMLPVPHLQYQFQVRVAIPAEQFRFIIMKLSQLEAAVSASVTNTEVRFLNGNGVMIPFLILRKPEQCIIEGNVGADPVSLVLDLRHVSAIMNASVMSNIVWLLGQSNGSSVMLDCPFGKLGNLKYYFPKPAPEA